MKSLILTKKLDYKGNTFRVNFKKKKQTKVKTKNIEKIMSRNIPDIMEKISCFLCKKQDKLFIKIGLVCESDQQYIYVIQASNDE